MRQPSTSFRRGVFLLIGMLLAFGLATPATAHQSGDRRTVDGVTIDLGVIPAELIRGHPAQHVESSMHGGRPSAQDEYHILVALFEAKTGARVTRARVRARVSEIGLVGEEKELAPMDIAGAETFGNYFSMAGNGPFRISLSIRVPNNPEEITTVFEHWHQ